MALITAVLACYRLAHLLPEDEGPLFIFVRIRSFFANKAIKENDDLGLWANIDSGINCVYCCGLYAALLVAILTTYQTLAGDLFLLVFAISGGQSLLQKLGDK